MRRRASPRRPGKNVRDRYTHATTLVSAAARPGERPDSSSGAPTISADGRYVVFSSQATNMIAAGTPAYRTHIYLRDRSRDTTKLIDRASTGRISTLSDAKATITPNARYAVFSSQGLDPPNDAMLFRRNLVTGRTTLVSVSILGGPANGF